MNQTFGSKNKTTAATTTNAPAPAQAAPKTSDAAGTTSGASLRSAAKGPGSSRGKKLVIVESPGKIKTLSHILGPEYRVMASVGHIRELSTRSKTSKDGVNTSNWTGDFIESESKAEVIQNLKRAAGEAELIILATDPDREGEAIAWHLSEVIKCPAGVKMTRATWSEITETAVNAGIAAARDIDMKMVDAQKARQFVDRLFGFPGSRWLSEQMKQSGLSAGRVQSPALRLVVERDREIEQFVPKHYGGASLVASAEGKAFKADLFKVGGKFVSAPDKEGKSGHVVLTPAEASALTLPKPGETLKVHSLATKPGRRAPEEPFTFSTLAIECAKRLGMSTEDFKRITQKLYEGDGKTALTTYPRTDSPNVSEEAQQMARDRIVRDYGKEYLPAKPLQYKSKDSGAQEAHECLRPSHLEPESEKAVAAALAYVVSKEGKAAEEVYNLIVSRFLACQMKDKTFNSTTAILKFGAGKDELEFKATGNMPTFDGWERAYSEARDEDAPVEVVGLLPHMEEKGLVKTDSCAVAQKKTKPPTPFDEGALIKELKDTGLGRPATIPTIIKVLQDREYVKKVTKGSRKNVLTSTDLGRNVVDALVPEFTDEMDPEYTQRMEIQLSEIAQGKLELKVFMDTFWKVLKAHF